MTEDIRELREKVLALTHSVESRTLKYRLHEIEERLAELLRLNNERDRSHEAAS